MTDIVDSNFPRQVAFLKELVRAHGMRSILDANAHGADEHIQLKDLKLATRVIAATLRDLLRLK